MTQISRGTIETNGIEMHLAEGGTGPLVVLCHGFPESWYSWRHQLTALAEAGFEHDVRRFIRSNLYSISGDIVDREPAALMVPRQGGLLARWATHFVNPATLPSWLTEADVDFYANEFARTGFRGGLNYYRNIDRNWELLAAFTGARVTVPAL